MTLIRLITEADPSFKRGVIVCQVCLKQRVIPDAVFVSYVSSTSKWKSALFKSLGPLEVSLFYWREPSDGPVFWSIGINYTPCTWWFELNFYYTSLLAPGDPGGLGTPIYVFTVESPQPVGARQTSCTKLLWKPHDPSREGTPIYLVTFEISRPVGARNTSCKQLLWKPRDPSREGTHIYLVYYIISFMPESVKISQLLRLPNCYFIFLLICSVLVIYSAHISPLFTSSRVGRYYVANNCQ
jgi:hypothetical protein